MTDRIHVEDLTTNHTPFGLLDDDTQARLKAWPHGVEVFSATQEWSFRDSVADFPSLTYRAIPAPLEKPSADWSQIGPAVNHIARDANGRVHGYEAMPRRCESWGDWGATSGRVVLFADRLFPSYRPGAVKWFDSLISRPGVVE